MLKPAVAFAFLLFAPAAAAQTAPGAWAEAEVRSLVQPSNAERFEAVKRLLEAQGLAYEVRSFPGSNASGGLEGRNIIVTLGEGPKDIVLGAHYDAAPGKDGKLVEGVVDNGASVVALVRAAGALQQMDLNHRVVLAFWDQEEMGLLGSSAWLTQVDRSRIAAAVNFDVAGYGDTVVYGGLKSDSDGILRGVMGDVCTARALDCIRFENYPPSDDRPFAAAGIPVISIGLQPAADAHQMWLLMHKGQEAGLAQGVVPRVFTLIHSPDDNMSALEPAAVELARRTAVDVVVELDRALAAR